jgi:hypothetical protein
MIYLFIIKAYRWTVFAVFFVAVLYVGLQNTPGAQTPYKTEVLAAFGVIIALHFALMMFMGHTVMDALFRMYFDNHYTIVMPNGIKRTVKAHVFREIQHEYDNVEGVKIYYNHPDGTPNFWKRIA